MNLIRLGVFLFKSSCLGLGKSGNTKFRIADIQSSTGNPRSSLGNTKFSSAVLN